MRNVAGFERLLRVKFGGVRRAGGKNGLEFIVPCPTCGKKKLSINGITGKYQCWRGCMHGHIDQLLGKVGLLRGDNEAPRAVAPLPESVESPGELCPLTFLEEDNPAIIYLTGRDFDPEYVDKTFGIRYCISGQSFIGGVFNTTNTLIMPVWFEGKLVGWQARLLYNPDSVPDEQCQAMGYIQDPDGDWIRPPKYCTDPNLEKGRVFYNYDWARQSEVGVLVEGVTDVWRVGRCGMAPLGKMLTDVQISMLKSYWKAIVLLLDPDAVADAKQMAMYESLSRCVPVVFVKLSGDQDPAERTRAAIWAEIGSSAHQAGINLLQYRILI